jgi:hypothetical protein
MLTRLCTVFFVLAMLALPAKAQGIYDNGPVNGTTDAWTINSGSVVSDTFTVAGQTLIAGLSFAAWVFPGDVLESVKVSIASSEFGGITYTNQIVSFSQSGCSGNQYGFNVCTESGTFGTFVNLTGGAYWISLSNAVVNTGDPIYWDENSGPSKALDWPRTTAIGTIPSEAFTVLGGTCGAGGCSPSQTVPEPSGLVSLVAGTMTLFGFFIVRRRKLF